MTSWSAILGVDGPPVRGEPREFAAARRALDDMAADAQRVVDGFAALVNVGAHPDRLHGSFTMPLQAAFRDVDEGLQVLPRVASDAADVFENHRSALVELRDLADDVFGRAVAAWTEQQELEQRARSVETQLATLTGTALQHAETQLEALHRRIGELRTALDRIGGEWADLRRDEDTLDDRCADELAGIDLGALKDPGFWDRIRNAVGDVLSAVADIAGGLIDGVIGLLDDVGRLLAEAWERIGELAAYHVQATARRIRNPLQSMWDLITGTWPLEDVSATVAIVAHGGRLYNDGPYCGREASCIVGGRVPKGMAGITLGHTVVFTDPDPPAWGTDQSWDRLVAHEMQHVYDIESVGGIGFYLSYGGEYVVNRYVRGMDDDTAYREIWWERRAYAVTRGEREPQGVWRDVWDAGATTFPNLPRLPLPPVPVPSIPGPSIPGVPPIISGPWNPPIVTGP